MALVTGTIRLAAAGLLVLLLWLSSPAAAASLQRAERPDQGLVSIDPAGAERPDDLGSDDPEEDACLPLDAAAVSSWPRPDQNPPRGRTPADGAARAGFRARAPPSA